ncbi:CBS domain-containing protein [Rhodovastum atsumiense]|uniref:CBS domain-containing protein n=1 Tax=Rhodovastum atsumiense TaxID=504468 RepID=A0A5M6IKJ8_9PROT|nr:CBS domain-containing protein [Rhodovastum atsumiense]KAA5608185.1 CBS domain-containing protein [Rhodovastum atsumiense]CAH2602551.1 CBS domain-containing protein [Rhodovastum atsumiense]
MQDRAMAEIVRDQRPLVAGPTATVAEACAAMHQRRVGAVLVVEEGDHLVGIFTGRDAVRCLAEGCDAPHTRLAQVMTREPVTLEPEHHAIDALRLFSDAGFRHLPICRDGRVCGIVSRYDFRAMEHARLDEETRFFEVLR